MRSHHSRRRSLFALEALEGRIALSHMGAAVEDGQHRNRGGHAEVHALRHGADDANHDVNDDNGGTAPQRSGADDPANHDQSGGPGEAVHHHRGRNATAQRGHRNGADDQAGHR